MNLVFKTSNEYFVYNKLPLIFKTLIKEEYEKGKKNNKYAKIEEYIRKNYNVELKYIIDNLYNYMNITKQDKNTYNLNLECEVVVDGKSVDIFNFISYGNLEVKGVDFLLKVRNRVKRLIKSLIRAYERGAI